MSRQSPGYTALVAITEGANRVCIVVTTAALALILCINGMEIVGRTAFSVSYAWGFETNLLLGAWLYFIGIYQVYHRNADITVEFFTDRLPARWRAAVATALNIVTCATLAVLVWFGWQLIELQLPFRTPGSRIPTALFTTPLVISAVLMIAVVARRTWELWLDDGETTGGPVVGPWP